MTALELFREIRKGGYTHNWIGVDWKVTDGCMIFEESDGKADWMFNFLSALRIPGRLAGTWFIFPLGAWLMWRTIRKTVKRLVVSGQVKEFAGYSQGAWFASYASAMTGRRARTFGCPRLGKGEAYLFSRVLHYKNDGDVVTMVPPWADIYGRVILLDRPIKRPGGLSEVEWLSHHSPEEYEARLS